MTEQELIMRFNKYTTAIIAAAMVTLGTYSGSLLAHGASAVMDSQGNDSAFTGLARVTCFNDGNGDTADLIARVRDNSAPVFGLYLTVHLLKGTRAIHVTDNFPGDAQYSPFISLPGGNGVYQMMLTKTQAGARAFDLEWHCMTAGNIHTGTDIVVDQFD
ncbi:hypothetical protein [Thiocapsa sp.]|uniref:hypothetical protein n=1 Tax=Thiocapsa sp. TaxID=2024551 RepID=UPI0035947E4C